MSRATPDRRRHPAGLDDGSYEVLRRRLATQAGELARRAEALNARRLEVFGSTELRLLSTERIRTEHNCVPRDIVSVGGLMLFGYNVFIGLKPETSVDDVFSLHRFGRESREAGEGGDDGPEVAGFRFDEAGHDELPGLLRDPQFVRDFGELYRYYRQARLLQLRRVDGRLLAVFQTGPRTEDIRVLRWRVGVDGVPEYLDSRGERDHVFPPSHDFEWTETTREDHVLGRHPHISIDGQVFVETVGGTLTVKVENNTEVGEGVYSEPVDEPLQSLADADVHWARVGPLILLRLRPYKETQWRHLVFNTLTREVVRLDGIGVACQRLPEDHGIIFPGGYHLVTGVTRTFDTDVSELEFERVVRSPNGEDVLYVFHARADGRSLLLPYNAIRKEVAAPIPCHGFSLFDDGTLVVFRAVSEEPTRVHPMQVWQTPYVSDAYAAAQPAGTGPLERIGNADLVRGISDCLSAARMVDGTATAEVYDALLAACARITDHYHWLGEDDLGDLATPLAGLRRTAAAVLEEHEKVRTLTERARAELDDSAEQIASLARRARGEAPLTADDWVTQLGGLRRARGHLETLRELRYVDHARIDELAGRLDEELAVAGRRAVEFLRRDEAFTGYQQEVARLATKAAEIGTVAEAGTVHDELAARTDGLQTITDVVGGLDIADATVRTGILGRVGEVLGAVNRARAVLDKRRRELAAAEPPSSPCSGRRSPGRWRRRTPPSAATSNWAGCCCGWRSWSPDSASSTTSSPNWPPGAPTSTRRSPPVSRRCSTSGPAAPTGSSPPPNGSWSACTGEPAPSARSTTSTPTSRPIRWWTSCARWSRSCVPSATRCGPRSWSAGSGPPARRPGVACATGSTCTPTAVRRSGWVGTASR